MNTFVVFPHLFKLHAHDALVNCLCDIEVHRRDCTEKKAQKIVFQNFIRKYSLAVCANMFVSSQMHSLSMRTYTAKTLACMPIFFVREGENAIGMG